MNKKQPKFKQGSNVMYNGIKYTIRDITEGSQGFFYRLADRLGQIHETELERHVKKVG